MGGRQAPLFVLAAGGGGRGGRGGVGNYPVPFSARVLMRFPLMISWPPACVAAPSTPAL